MTKRKITIITLAIILAALAMVLLWTPLFRVNAILIGVLCLVTAIGAGIIWYWRRSAYPALAWVGAIGLFLATLWFLPNLICPYTMRQLGVISSGAACPCGETRGPCNDYDLKPCGGWSSQMNKSISCSAGGVLTVNGNVVGTCAGCCFSYEISCNDCPNANAPSVTGSLSGTTGIDGWIVANPGVSLSSSDADGDPTTISGSINGSGFSCGASCTQSLPQGTGMVSFTASDGSRTSALGSLAYKVDTIAPSLNINQSGTSGSNGWYISPVTVSSSASDGTSGLASMQVRANGGAWQGSLMLSSEGTHSVDATASDHAGNQASANASVKIDTTPPTGDIQISGTTGSNGWYRSASVSMAASDATSGIASAQVSTGASWSSSINLPDGSYIVQGLAFDMAGHQFAASPVSVDVDGTAPSVIIAVSGGTTGSGGWYTAGPISVSVASSLDMTSGVEIIERRVNGGAWQTGATVSVSGDGLYTIEFRVTDKAGNQAAGSRIIQIDGTQPDISPSIPAPDGAGVWYVASPVTAAFSASDAISGVASTQYAIDGGAWISDTSASLSGEGVHQVDFRATDAAGNQVSYSQTLMIDTIPPSLSLAVSGGTFGSSGWYNVGPVEVTANTLDATSGVGVTEYRVNGGAWVSGSLATISNDGIYSVEFRATDNAGNQTVDFTNLRVDKMVPTILAIIPVPTGSGGWFTSSPVSLAFSATDNLSGVDDTEYTIDGGPWIASTSFDVVGDGQHNVTLHSSDKAGNILEETHTIKIDTIPPTVSDEGGTAIKGIALLGGSASDAGAGIARVEIKPPDGDWQTVILKDGRWSYILNTTRLENAPTTLQIRVTDNAGIVVSKTYTYMVKNPRIPLVDYLVNIFRATPTSTITPTPTPTVTPLPTEKAKITAFQVPLPTNTAIPLHTLAPTPAPAEKSPRTPFNPNAALVAAVFLFGAIGASAVIDPRPRALSNLRRTLERIHEVNNEEIGQR